MTLGKRRIRKTHKKICCGGFPNTKLLEVFLQRISPRFFFILLALPNAGRMAHTLRSCLPAGRDTLAQAGLVSKRIVQPPQAFFVQR